MIALVAVLIGALTLCLAIRISHWDTIEDDHSDIQDADEHIDRKIE